MTEKPELEKNAYGDIIEPPFDPSKIPSFDPMQEFAEKGQLHQKNKGAVSIGKEETPAEKIEREERDRRWLETIAKLNNEQARKKY